MDLLQQPHLAVVQKRNGVLVPHRWETHFPNMRPLQGLRIFDSGVLQRYRAYGAGHPIPARAASM